MIKKFVLSLALVGPVMATGATASADYTVATDPPPPVTSVGDFSGSDRPEYSASAVRCIGRVACESLQRYCAKNGGNYYDVSDLNGGLGVCIGL